MPNSEKNTHEKLTIKMTTNLEALAQMDYPGRFIILGRGNSRDESIVVYGITGRSPPSQARKLEYNEEKEQIQVQPTDKKLLEQGNPDLLIYPAIDVYNPTCGITVSNGKQTEDIQGELDSFEPAAAIVLGNDRWSYEPDEPNYTPRISGCISETDNASLGIIKRDTNDLPLKQIFEFPLTKPHMGKLIATYTGQNQTPLPSFQGNPLDVFLKTSTAQQTAKSVYEVLNPKFRVAVAAVHYNRKAEKINHAIINRHEQKKS